MVCRTAQIGSAVTSYAIQTSALEEQQVLSLYHEVMREGRSAPTPDHTQRLNLIEGLRRDVATTPGLSDARRRSITTRLERSVSEDMDGRRWYGSQRLMRRVRQAEHALDAYVAGHARDTGMTTDEVRSRLAALREEAGNDRTLRAPRGWASEQFSGTHHLPLDRQTAYALHRMQETLDQTPRTTRPVVERRPVPGDSVLADVGYDPNTGRLEVTTRANPDHPQAYTLSEDAYRTMRGHPRGAGWYYETYIRNNPGLQYQDAETAAAAGVQTQCTSCGQFDGDSHACPPRGSTQEINRTVRRARRAARPETVPATEPAERRRMVFGTRTRARSYGGASGMFRSLNLTEIRQQARQGQGVTAEVSATVVRVSQGPGRPVRPVPTGYVSGTVQVDYQRGQGYTVSATTAPGDSGDDQLRCACEDYRRNYDCEHIRQTVQDFQTRINQESLRAHHDIGPAIEQVNAELATDLAESQEAQQAAQENLPVAPVIYGEDHAAFQADYRAARNRIAAGEQAIPYMTENATGGLGARGTGRAFGVELEFDVADDAPGGRAAALQRIGRALHREGLTRTPGQGRYHAAAGRGYTEEHQGGWSFEADCTVAGEIVSPIMYDTPETWENLDKVVKIIQDNGGVVTQRTGCHVHVSAGNYDHTVANHNRLLGMFAENEDLIYRLSSDPGRGTHRGSRWCSPNRVPSEGYSDVRRAQYGNNSHGLGLNLQSVSGSSSDHVEFRTWDGSLNSATIQSQIKLSLAMTEAAFRDTDYQPSGHTPLGSHRAHNRQEFGDSRRLTGEAWRQDVAGYKTFADRLFHRPEDKAQITALFASTRWQRTGR